MIQLLEHFLHPFAFPFSEVLILVKVLITSHCKALLILFSTSSIVSSRSTQDSWNIVLKNYFVRVSQCPTEKISNNGFMLPRWNTHSSIGHLKISLIWLKTDFKIFFIYKSSTGTPHIFKLFLTYTMRSFASLLFTFPTPPILYSPPLPLNPSLSPGI